ncbi:MAG: hypothetical protein WA849_02215 [Candidatus Udaeobacter sp.]
MALNYPIFNEKPWLFAACLIVVLAFSILLFFLASRRSWVAIVAVFVALVWIILLEPDLQYYLETRNASSDSIVEPFYREYYIRGYILVFMPLPFVLLGLRFRRRRI